MKKLLFIISVLIFSVSGIFAQSKVKVDNNTFGAIRARQIGPATMSGRIATLDAVNANPNILYVGTAGGGVWKTKNGGITFKPIFDKYTQCIGAVRIDQKHPETVWAGTGEPWTRNSTSVGNGIFKSTDGGESWQFLGLKNTERIARIAIDPNNSDVVYVAALGHLWGPNSERGLYKTEDGGKTWKKILYVDENTGCSDVVVSPFNSNVLYAGMWQFRRSAYYFNSGGKGSALYKSTDAGKSWKKLITDLPKGEKGRIALSISPVDSSVYAVIEAKETALYRSKDEGKTWDKVNKTRVINERPFYFGNIVADPLKKNRVYKPGFNISVSDDGGKHFRGTSVEGGAIHPDIHALYIGTNDNKLLYIGTDGGVFVSRDGGSSWAMFRNLPVAQFYHVSADMQIPYYVYGGLQDNNSWYGPSESAGGISNSDWKKVGFGDGFYAYADRFDKNIVYWQWQGGQFARADIETGEFKSIKPYKDETTDDLRFNWNAPLIFSNDGKRMYSGAQYLFISENRGDTWKRISPDLTTNDKSRQQQETTGGLTLDNSTAENHCSIVTINESPLDKNIIWAGTDDGNIQVTTDGGKTWDNVTENIPGLPEKTWCSYVEPGHFKKGVCYATFDGHKSNDMNAYVYKTEDFGKTWVSVSGENIPIYCHIIKQDFVNPNLLFLGTEFGLYTSVDDGQTWARFKSNFPKVSVRDMQIHPRENDLILATHGRGILIIDDIEPLRQLSQDVLNSDVSFLKTKPYLIKTSQRGGSYSGDDEYTGSNPTDAAIITYYLKKRHVFGDMYIEVFDKDKKRIAKLPAGKRRGINKVSWFVRMKPPKVPASPQLVGFAMQGPTVQPGKYKVVLVKGKKSYTSEIEIKLDPNSKHSDTDRQIRLDNLMKAYNLLEKLAFLDKQLLDMRDQSKEIKPKVNKRYAKKLSDLIKTSDNLHKRLVATKKGNITGEEKIREKLGELYGFILFYDGRPTDSQINRLKGLEKDINEIETEIKTLKSKYVRPINTYLLKTNKKPIFVTTKEKFDKENK